MDRLVERLKNYWSSIGAEPRPGVAQETLNLFESRYRIKVPEEFRNYVCTVDGMKEGSSDNEIISFWPLHSIRSIDEALPSFAGIPDYSRIVSHLREAGSYFVFADYLIWSHVYAIKLSLSTPFESPVLWIYGSKHDVIAESFSKFLEMYLDNPQSVLFPKTVCG